MDNYRDEKGRYRKGFSGNAGGRSKNEARELMRAALSNALTPERAAVIAEKLLVCAERNDAKAREHLFRFLGIFDDNVGLTINAPGLETILQRVYGQQAN